ncbi:MAG: hypothetical protein IKD27_08715 [Oscillospiraceae bacterium]|nr:hypothetical protein [Oscillospiraceae bacterium]
MGWLITLAILVLLAILPLGASVLYDEDGVAVRVVAGPLKIKVFPLKKKPKKDKPKKEKKPKKEEKPKEEALPAEEVAPAKEKKPAPKQKKGGSLLDFLPLVKIALELLNDFRRKLRVDYLKLHLTMAADDPCDLAINYGRMNASMAGLITQLERVFVIKKRDVHIDCDFTANKTVILARLDLTITLGRILYIAVYHGVRALMTFLKIKKQQEGGADL